MLAGGYNPATTCKIDAPTTGHSSTAGPNVQSRLRVVQNVVAIGRRPVEPLDVDEGLLAAGHEMACAERLVGALKPTSGR